MDEDYQIFFIDDMKVNELVTENPDGSYTILINNDLCESKQKKAISHALKHIENRDFEKYDVQRIETEAHKNESRII